MGRQDLNERELLAGLTDKQRQVLDLLIEHKTSKEIARLLEISPHTVDQRIQFAKQKLGAATRSEAAVAYRRLLEICGQTTYQDSGIAHGEPGTDEGHAVGVPVAESAQRTRTAERPSQVQDVDFPVGRTIFDGRHGTLVRLGAIVGIAVLLVLLVLGALATFSQLSELMSKGR